MEKQCDSQFCTKHYDAKLKNCPYCGAPNSNIIVTYEDVNPILLIITWLSIIAAPIRLLSRSISLWGFNFHYFFPNAILIALYTFFIIKILHAKRWAFFLWLGTIFLVAIYNDLIIPGFYLSYTIAAIIMTLLMIALLHLKKDGVSIWSLMFNTKKSKFRFCCKCYIGPCVRWDKDNRQ